MSPLPAPFDQIRDLIPPTEPVDVDVDIAGAEFTELAALIRDVNHRVHGRQQTHRPVRGPRLLLR